MSSDVFPPCLQSLWRTTWGLDKTLIKECGSDCTAPDNFIAAAFDHAVREFPGMKGGMFSSTGDQTIRTFAGYGWSGGYNMCKDIPNAVTSTVYQAGLAELRTRVMADSPGLGTYYVTGSSHTILRSGNFYTQKVGDTTAAQWMTNAISGTTSHLGP
jgi:hypothetical protein